MCDDCVPRSETAALRLDANYRACMAQVYRRPMVHATLLILSATLPVRFEVWFKDRAGREVLFIRTGTARLGLEYYTIRQPPGDETRHIVRTAECRGVDHGNLLAGLTGQRLYRLTFQTRRSPASQLCRTTHPAMRHLRAEHPPPHRQLGLLWVGMDAEAKRGG